MSIIPVFSLINNTFFHVFPPSEVLKIPRSLFGVYKWPITPTTISSGLFLLIIILPIWCESVKPAFTQVMPLSVLFKIPIPE